MDIRKYLAPRKLIGLLFTLLVAFAPSGTRYIFRTGSILGHPVEPGTVSVFGMQLVAVAFAALTFWTYGGKRVVAAVRTPAGLFASCIALFSLLSSLRAVDPLAGLTAAGFVLVACAVFLAIIVYRPDPHEVLASFVGGAVFQVAIGGWQFFTQHAFASKWLGMAVHSADQLGAFVIETETGRWLRAYGSLSHPNIFGLYVGIGLLMCVGLAAFRGHGKHLRFFALMPVIAAGLLFSFSRSAILAVAAGFIWLVASAYGSDAAPHFRRVLLPSFLIIAVTVGVLGWLYVEPLRTRAAIEGRLEERSITDRTRQYSDALYLFARHPFTGVGVGQMPLALAREAVTDRNWWQYDYVHSVPLLVAAEIGLVGFGIWVGFIVSTLVVIVRRLRRRTETATGVTVYSASFIALVVASLFDHFLWSSWFGQLLFWTVAGLLHAAYLKIPKER